jgi:hypothetical protein
MSTSIVGESMKAHFLLLLFDHQILKIVGSEMETKKIVSLAIILTNLKNVICIKQC